MTVKYKMSDEISNGSFKESQSELANMITEICGPNQFAWLEDHVNQTIQISKELLLSKMGENLLKIGKSFSKKFVVISFSERTLAATPSPFGLVPVGHWLRNDLARIYFITQVFEKTYQPSERFIALYKLYDAGDTESKVACLRALNFIEGVVADGLEIIHDAGRTYLSELMEAGWCHHPFSSQQLTTEEFRKAVMKALFCNVSIEGFMGIDRIADQELSRRLSEFANEREAADRTVPAAVWRVASYFPVPGLVARLIGRLEHPSAEERETAVISLGRTRDPKALPFMEDRLLREEDMNIKCRLEEAISLLTSMN